jgi:hypothetical protein
MTSIGDNIGLAGSASNPIDIVSSDTEEFQYDGTKAYRFGKYSGSLRANRVQVPHELDDDDTQEQPAPAVVTPIKVECFNNNIHMQDSEDDSSRFSGGQVYQLRRHSSSEESSLFSHSSDDMDIEGPVANAMLLSSEDRENGDNNSNSALDDGSLFSHSDDDLIGIHLAGDGNHFANEVDSGKPAVKRPKPMIPKSLVSAKSYPVILRENKDDSYFALKWGGGDRDIIIKDTFFSSGPPDPDFCKCA